jgi:hypothetical protein
MITLTDIKLKLLETQGALGAEKDRLFDVEQKGIRRGKVLQFSNKKDADERKRCTTQIKRLNGRIDFLKLIHNYMESAPSIENISMQRAALVNRLAALEERIPQPPMVDKWQHPVTGEWEYEYDTRNPVWKKEVEEWKRIYKIDHIRKQIKTLSFILKSKI